MASLTTAFVCIKTVVLLNKVQRRFVKKFHKITIKKTIDQGRFSKLRSLGKNLTPSIVFALFRLHPQIIINAVSMIDILIPYEIVYTAICIKFGLKKFIAVYGFCTVF